MRTKLLACIWAAGTVLFAGAAQARIKLATLPVRERVEIQLDNGTYTLVEEERIVPLLKSTRENGNNRVDFSWSNTRIDKDTILFRPIAIREKGRFRAIRDIAGRGEVNVINVACPPGENALVWEVFAAEACAVEDVTGLTPLDDKMRLYLGESRDIICTRIIKENKRYPVRGNLHHQELVIRYEVENYKDKACRLDIVEQINRLCQEYAGDPHGDSEWETGDRTSRAIDISYPTGKAEPVLSVKLPARPKDKDKKVEKQVFTFHVMLKNVW